MNEHDSCFPRPRFSLAPLILVHALGGSGLLSLAGPAPATAADLCQGLVQDKLPHPMTPLAKPALGATVIDPEFGTVIRRITEVPQVGSNPALRPMYSTTSAWNADESLLILYQVGQGHQLYDGHSYAFLRPLDINPADLEQVYWHTSLPDILHYVDGQTLIRYHVSSDTREPLRTFEFCSGDVYADSHGFTSWDSNVLALKCDSTVFTYRISDDTILGSVSSPLDPPLVGASGNLHYWVGDVASSALAVQRTLDLGYVYEHSALGRYPDGRDTYNLAAYDPGPLGSEVGSLVTFDMADGSWKVVIGPDTGYRYPPSGTHLSSLAYREPGWVFVSIVGDPAGQQLLDNEILLANTETGAVCRIAHHRSYGKGNTKLGLPYWAEPHVTASPSGTRALFASDWGDGPTVDAYVIELPGYTPPAATSVLLRNSEWPAIPMDTIFTGPVSGCPPPLDPGCPAPGSPNISLDPTGADCDPDGLPRDDDFYLRGFACGSVDPEATVLTDATRPLMFYQLDRNPSLCSGLRLAKTAGGQIAVSCN